MSAAFLKPTSTSACLLSHGQRGEMAPFAWRGFGPDLLQPHVNFQFAKPSASFPSYFTSSKD